MRKSITLRTARGGWRTSAAALAVGAALVLTACGSDDESGDDTTENSASDDADTSDTSDDTDASDDTEDEGDTEDEADSGSGDTGDYCDAVLAMGNGMTDASAMTDPEAAADLAEDVRAIANAAPSDIAGDWSTFADALETLGDLDMTDPEAMEDLDLDAFTEASTRVSTHVAETCA
jgi:hypothetical protein